MTVVAINLIGLDERNRAFIIGTRARVSMVVRDRLAGLSAEDIHDAYPYLTLAQIYAALAFYYDNRPAIDREIAAEDVFIDQLRQDAAKSGRELSRAELEKRLS